LIFTELKFAKDSYNNRTVLMLPKAKLLKGWPIEVDSPEFCIGSKPMQNED
jgi:hypothetical protein